MLNLILIEGGQAFDEVARYNPQQEEGTFNISKTFNIYRITRLSFATHANIQRG
jgi:hypothetical protein